MSDRAIFDTNIVIDYLNSVPQAVRLIDRCETPMISRLTFAEVLIKHEDTEEQGRVGSVLAQRFEIADTTQEIALAAVETRQKRQRDGKRMGLVDAFIYALSIVNNCHVYTRNPKDFRGLPQTIEPYATRDVRGVGLSFWAGVKDVTITGP